MGTQKLLLPLGNQTVIARVVDAVRRAPVDRTIVVVGAHGEAMREALQGRPVSFVVNPDPDGDMLGSVRCGLRAVPNECAGVLIVLGDHPSVRTTWINRMVLCFRETGDGIVVPVHRGKRGHPILVSARFRDELLSRYDGVGLRGLLQAHEKQVTAVEVASPEVLEDLDTPDDYERQRSKFE